MSIALKSRASPSAAAFSIGAGVALVTTILIALATAIVLGINVTDAANPN